MVECKQNDDDLINWLILKLVLSYEGEWSEGLKKGKGKFTYGNGDVFEGIYDNNERHGDGNEIMM